MSVLSAPFASCFALQIRATGVQAAAAGVRASLSTYREVRDNLSEGLRFYMSLQEAIGTLAQQAGDYSLTRRLQR